MSTLSRLRAWSLAGSLLVLPLLAVAQPSTNFAKRLSDVESLVATLGQAVVDLRTQNTALATRLNALDANTAVQLAARDATIAALQARLTREIADRATYADAAAAGALASAKSYSDTRLAPVSDKLQHVSRSGNNLYITGANLYVRNGLGATVNNGFNGLGNLILGYNESRGQTNNPDVRTGSHNLIVGSGANYSRNASIITGINNTSDGHLASVYGGTGNLAKGTYSVVVGGYNNQANGGWSTILGGRDRVANGQLDHLP